MVKKMLTDEDKALWEAYTKTVTPLNNASRLKNFGRKLIKTLSFKRKAEVPNVLDLHGFTLQEAYDLFNRFLNYHYANNTPRIVVITGKGKDGKGLLKNEFPKWLENATLKDKIQDIKRPLLNDGGAFELTLKKRKK